MISRACFVLTVAALLALACSEPAPSTTGETHFIKCNTDLDCASLGASHACVAGQCTDEAASACASAGPPDWDVEVEGSRAEALASDRVSGDVVVVAEDTLGTTWMARLTSEGRDRWRRDVIPASANYGYGAVAFGTNQSVFFASSYLGAFELDGVRLAASEVASTVVAKIEQGSSAWWVRNLSESSGSVHAMALASDPTGGAVVLARYSQPPFGGLLISALGPTGDETWRRVFEGAEGASPYSSSVAVDEAGDALIVGTVFGGQIDFGGGALPESKESPSFVVKLGPDGSHRWSRLLPGSRVAESVAIGADSGIYVAGRDARTNAQNQPFVAKLDTDGNVVWELFPLGDGTSLSETGRRESSYVKVAAACTGALVMTNWGEGHGGAIFSVESDGTWKLTAQVAEGVSSAAVSDFHGGFFLAGNRLLASEEPPSAMFVFHTSAK